MSKSKIISELEMEQMNKELQSFLLRHDRCKRSSAGRK